MLKNLVFFLLICCSFAPLSGFQCQLYDTPTCFCDLFCGPHRLGIGPEFYYIERKRDGKKAEDGYMIGERMTYERLRPWCIYYGAEQYYAVGCISRRTLVSTEMLSKLQDAEVEARIGYTLMNSWRFYFMFTPFVGYGNFTGTNKFLLPRFLKLTFRPTFNYFTTGFLSALYFCNGQASIGLNIKWKSMRHSINRVIDRSHGHCISFYQRMGDRTQIQVDLPLTYYYWYAREQAFEIAIVPFYRNRIYGAHRNFPFDFLETKFEMWGSRFMINYAF